MHRLWSSEFVKGGVAHYNKYQSSSAAYQTCLTRYQPSGKRWSTQVLDLVAPAARHCKQIELHCQYLVPLRSAVLSMHGSIAGGPLQGAHGASQDQDGSERLPP